MVAEKVQELEQENIALKEQLKKLQGICSSIEVQRTVSIVKILFSIILRMGKSIIQYILVVARQEIG